MEVSSSTLILLIFSLSLTLPVPSRASDETTFNGINIEHPAVDVTPSPLPGHLSKRIANDVILCERVRVSGHSRLQLSNYANAFRVTLSPSAVIPERLHRKIHICFHRNASLGLCQCDNNEWENIQKGLWNSVMSPYDNKYVDVKFSGEVSGYVTVAVEEDFQQWRLLCLAVGFVLLLLAPIVSSWVPFYYSSSMAIGVFLVFIILLFQGMKLLPTGRKNFFYLTIYGSVLGAWSFVLHHFSEMLNSILLNLGLTEEMHNPVGIFLLVGVILAGAALGYWIVRKFVISKDGSVDVGVAQFVKWAMRIVGTTFILQSTLDTSLAMGALVSCCAVCYLITSPKRHNHVHHSHLGKGSHGLHRSPQPTMKHNRAEFLSRSANMGFRGNMWSSPKGSPTWSKSPIKGVILSSPGERINQRDYYSTFHKTGRQKKFTKEEWEDFTRESTRQAIAELAAAPEFTDFLIERADRIKILPSDSSDESSGSESGSTDEAGIGSCSPFRLFNW